MTANQVIVRNLGTQEYLSTWEKMQHFTAQRDENTLDEIWILEHPPIFTQGQNGKPEHILNPGDINVIQVDRGGQVTYHGPGQIVAYILVDLKRKKLNVRDIVQTLEKSIMQTLNDFHITSETRCKAPGVYANNKKIASIGLRIRKGCSFHGLALNVAMDLEPFSRINPCGFEQLEMTQLIDFNDKIEKSTVAEKLIGYLTINLGYTSVLR